jgi:hypothetical protein
MFGDTADEVEWLNGQRLGTYDATEDARGFIGVYLNVPQQKVLVGSLRVRDEQPPGNCACIVGH